jgi:hypothetical protein
VTSRAIRPEGERFRSRVIDALEARDGRRVGYCDEDTIDARCPCCFGLLSVYFHGAAPRADLVCRGGCSEQEVADALGLATRPTAVGSESSRVESNSSHGAGSPGDAGASRGAQRPSAAPGAPLAPLPRAAA